MGLLKLLLITAAVTVGTDGAEMFAALFSFLGCKSSTAPCPAEKPSEKPVVAVIPARRRIESDEDVLDAATSILSEKSACFTNELTDQYRNPVVSTAVESLWAVSATEHVNAGEHSERMVSMILRMVRHMGLNDRGHYPRTGVTEVAIIPRDRSTYATRLSEWSAMSFKDLLEVFVGATKKTIDDYIVPSDSSAKDYRYCLTPDDTIEKLSTRARRIRSLFFFADRGRISITTDTPTLRRYHREHSFYNKDAGIMGSALRVRSLRNFHQSERYHTGKVMNVADEDSNTVKLFRRLGAPFVAGASGTILYLTLAMEEFTVPVVTRGPQPTRADLMARIRRSDKPLEIAASFPPVVLKLHDRERLIGVWLMSLVNMGHHSVMEGLFVAKAMGYFGSVPLPYEMADTVPIPRTMTRDCADGEVSAAYTASLFGLFDYLEAIGVTYKTPLPPVAAIERGMGPPRRRREPVERRKDERR